ncbi:extracellular calcium-sensing receptor-like [Ranitomeya imitator]|uniref:extracellular calcium-sensing receptor-like n=1 Tax=Ranitomeya imitator TaxID=111125 RepID=UPI0037E99869
MAQLIFRFGWTWIGLLALDNDYGLQGIQPIKEEIIKAGACVAFMEYISLGQPDRNAPHIAKVMKESTATVVVVFATDIEFIPILNELLKRNVTGKIFIGNAGWSRSLLLSISKYFQLLSGSLSLASNDYIVPGLSQFLDKIHPSTSTTPKWTKMMWETVFNCQFLPENQTVSLGNPVKVCTGLERIEDIKNNAIYTSSLKMTYVMFVAVHVLVKALDDLKTCKIGEGPFSKRTCANIWHFKPWQLLYYMRRVKVNINLKNEKYFDENGDPPGLYAVANWNLEANGTLAQVKIGIYNNTAPPPEDLTMNRSVIVWNLGSQQVGANTAEYDLNCFRCPWDEWPNPEKSKCLLKPTEFLSYEDLLGVSLATAAIISSIIPAPIFGLLFHFSNTALVKASNYSLSCFLLISISLCFLCSLGFIGYPDHEKCLLRQVSFGLIFSLCVACILAKTVMVVFAFMATRPGSSLRKWTTLRVSYSIISICFLLQLILCISWMSVDPPFPQLNTADKSELIIIDCNDRSVKFWAMLGYLFLLATISFIVAFLARKLPDSFNEAQFITFSMLAFLSVWLSFIPASLSAQGKYTVAMEVFAILASSWALLICMFFPKCFILLFRPEMNSKEYLMRNKDKGAINKF